MAWPYSWQTSQTYHSPRVTTSHLQISHSWQSVQQNLQAKTTYVLNTQITSLIRMTRFPICSLGSVLCTRTDLSTSLKCWTHMMDRPHSWHLMLMGSFCPGIHTVPSLGCLMWLLKAMLHVLVMELLDAIFQTHVHSTQQCGIIRSKFSLMVKKLPINTWFYP